MKTFLKNIRTVLVEDSRKMIARIQSYMLQEPDFQIIASCRSVSEALPIIKANTPDLLLLDIHLKDGTAFDLLEKIETEFPYKVIFITSFTDYAIRAIKFGALDYIIKPIIRNELIAALHKVQENSPVRKEQVQVANHNLERENSKIVIPDQEGLQIVFLKEIIYGQSDSGYTTFYLTENRKVKTCRYIKEYEDILGEEFIKPHQSFIVNISFIEKYYKAGYLKLKDDTKIPVSFRKKDEVIGYLKKSLWL